MPLNNPTKPFKLHSCQFQISVNKLRFIIPVNRAWCYTDIVFILKLNVRLILPSQLELYNTLTAALQRGKTPPTSVLFMTLNNLMVRFQ